MAFRGTLDDFRRVFDKIQALGLEFPKDQQEKSLEGRGNAFSLSLC